MIDKENRGWVQGGEAPAAPRPSPSAEVVDDLPSTIPLSAEELDAVESYLGQLIDQIFNEQSSDPSAPCDLTRHDDGTAN